MNYHRTTKIAFSLFLIGSPFVSGCSQISNPDINNQIGFIVCDSTKIQEEEEDKSINPKQTHKGEIWFALNRRTSNSIHMILIMTHLFHIITGVKIFGNWRRVHRLFKVTSEIKGILSQLKIKSWF